MTKRKKVLRKFNVEQGERNVSIYHALILVFIMEIATELTDAAVYACITKNVHTSKCAYSCMDHTYIDIWCSKRYRDPCGSSGKTLAKSLAKLKK